MVLVSFNQTGVSELPFIADKTILCDTLCNFQVVLPSLAVLRITVYEESGKLIGQRILPVVGLSPGECF